MGALRWHGEPCQGKNQVNEVKQPHWAVPGVWKPEHFQAAVGSVIPAKFLSKGSSDCWPSSSVNLAPSTNLSRHSRLFEVINEALILNSRDRVYTHLLGKASTCQDHQSTVQPHQECFYQDGPTSRESLGGPRREDSQHLVTPVPATTGTCGASHCTPVMVWGISCQEAGPDCTRGE